MEYNRTHVYNMMNADVLEEGDKVLIIDNYGSFVKKLTNDGFTSKDIYTIKEILGEDKTDRFVLEEDNFIDSIDGNIATVVHSAVPFVYYLPETTVREIELRASSILEENRVFNLFNADKAKIGSDVIPATTLALLREKLTLYKEGKYRPFSLVEILSEDNAYRFKVKDVIGKETLAPCIYVLDSIDCQDPVDWQASTDFDIHKILTNVYTERATIGSVVIGANSIGNLAKKFDKWKNGKIEAETLVEILDDKNERRFVTKYNGHLNKYGVIYDLSVDNKSNYRPYVSVRELIDDYRFRINPNCYDLNVKIPVTDIVNNKDFMCLAYPDDNEVYITGTHKERVKISLNDLFYYYRYRDFDFEMRRKFGYGSVIGKKIK